MGLALRRTGRRESGPECHQPKVGLRLGFWGFWRFRCEIWPFPGIVETAFKVRRSIDYSITARVCVELTSLRFQNAESPNTTPATAFRAALSLPLNLEAEHLCLCHFGRGRPGCHQKKAKRVLVAQATIGRSLSTLRSCGRRPSRISLSISGTESPKMEGRQPLVCWRSCRKKFTHSISTRFPSNDPANLTIQPNFDPLPNQRY